MDKNIILKKKAIMEAEKSQLDLSVVGGMNCHYSGKPAQKPTRNRCELEDRSNFVKVGKFANLDRMSKEYRKESVKSTRVEYKK